MAPTAHLCPATHVRENICLHPASHLALCLAAPSGYTFPPVASTCGSRSSPYVPAPRSYPPPERRSHAPGSPRLAPAPLSSAASLRRSESSPAKSCTYAWILQTLPEIGCFDACRLLRGK